MNVAENVQDNAGQTERAQVDNILNEELPEETQQELDLEEPQEIEGEEPLEEEIPEEEQEVAEEEVEEDEVVLSGLSDVAKHLGVDQEELYAIEIPLADGEQPVTLSAMKDELRTHRQERQQFMYQQQQLAQAQEQFEQIRNTPGAQYNQELMDVQGAIQAIEAQDKAVDWSNVEDAGQAALYRQQLQEAKNEAIQKRTQILNEMQAKNQQTYVEQKNRDWQQILQVIPEWSDREVYTRDRADINLVGKNYGVSEAELQEMSDPRFNKLMYDYVQLLKKTNTAQAKAKEVRKRGVKIRSRGAQRVTRKQNAAVESKIKRAKATGSSRDQAAAVDALIS